MRLFTPEILAKDVAERWKKQYFRPDKKTWSETFSGSSENTYRKLVAANGEVAQIDKVLDGGGWIRLMCCECKQHKALTVEFGDGEWGAVVCADCIKAAGADMGKLECKQ